MWKPLKILMGNSNNMSIELPFLLLDGLHCFLINISLTFSGDAGSGIVHPATFPLPRKTDF